MSLIRIMMFQKRPCRQRRIKKVGNDTNYVLLGKIELVEVTYGKGKKEVRGDINDNKANFKGKGNRSKAKI